MFLADMFNHIWLASFWFETLERYEKLWVLIKFGNKKVQFDYEYVSYQVESFKNNIWKFLKMFSSK